MAICDADSSTLHTGVLVIAAAHMTQDQSILCETALLKWNNSVKYGISLLFGVDV